jgi:hypothetical protein
MMIDIVRRLIESMTAKELKAYGLMRMENFADMVRQGGQWVSLTDLQNGIDLHGEGYDLFRTEDIQEVALRMVESSSEHIDETALLQGCRDAGMSEEAALEALSIDPEEFAREAIRNENIGNGDVFDEIGLDSVKEWLLENMALKDVLTHEDVERGMEGWDIDAIQDLLNDCGDGYQVSSETVHQQWEKIIIRMRARIEQERNDATRALLLRISDLETSRNRLIHDRDMLLARHRGDVPQGDLVVKAWLDAEWEKRKQEGHYDHTDREAAMNEA